MVNDRAGFLVSVPSVSLSMFKEFFTGVAVTSRELLKTQMSQFFQAVLLRNITMEHNRILFTDKHAELIITVMDIAFLWLQNMSDNQYLVNGHLVFSCIFSLEWNRVRGGHVSPKR